MANETYDVIIVGAGPSGSQCARTLAASGARVLLLDKKRPGWHKPCGGGISEVALARFGIPLERWYRTEGVRIVDAAGTSAVAPMAFFDVRRNQFDEFLAGEAAERGVEVHYKTTIPRLARTSDGFEVETRDGTYRSRYLVGADGFTSTVRDQLFSEALDLATSAIALEYWYEWNHGVQHLDFYVEPELLPLGYSYAFPKDAQTITIGIAGLEIDEPRAVLEKMLDLPRYRALRGTAERVAVHGARIPYRPLSHLREGRLLLCGDAAGLNTPIAFAGLPIALSSGHMAGEALAEALRSGSDEPLERYTLQTVGDSSTSFRGCHAYWRHLCHEGTCIDWPAFRAETLRNPDEEPMLYVIWAMLGPLAAALDAPRLRRYASGGTINVAQS